MLLKERHLRIYGYLIVAFIFYIFFMLEMFFSWRDEHMWIKTLSITLLFTVAIWEPVRFIILKFQRFWPGLKNARTRIGFILLVVIPYSFLVGFLRIYIEDITNLWGVPIANFTAFSFNIGICLLFSLLQVAAYESIYFFDEWNKSKEEAEELRKVNFQVQFDSLKVQIQPHFLFNTLNTLIGLMKLDIPRAIRFTEEMAHVYRYLLEANDRQLISLADEMKFTNAYFFLLKTRYSEGLHLEVSGNEELNDYMLPPLSLQILLENAVKHNVITKDRPLFIKVEYNLSAQHLTISNNLQQKAQSFNTGVGLVHLKKKFELLRMPALVIDKAENKFSVTLPLLKSPSYESSNYRG